MTVNSPSPLIEDAAILRAVWDSAPDALVLSDSDGVVRAANPAYYRLYNLTPDQVIDKSFSIIFPETERAAAEVAYREVFARAEPPAPYLSIVRRGDGAARRVEAAASYLERDGRRVAMLSTIRDVTQEFDAREEAERRAERMQLLLSSSRVFVEAGFDLASVCTATCRQLTTIVGDGCTLTLISADGTFLEPLAIDHRDPDRRRLAESIHATARLRMGEGFGGRIAESGTAILVSSVTTDALEALVMPEHRSGTREFAVTSLLGVPMRVAGQTIGALMLTRHAGSPPYGEDDLRLAQDLADRAALGIAQARSVADLLNERDWLRQVLDLLPEAVVLADTRTGTYRLANRASSELLGEDVSGQIIANNDEVIFGTSRVDGTPLPSSGLPLQRAMAGEIVLGEQFVLRPAGAGDRDPVPLLANAAPLRDASGDIVGAVITFQDISGMKDLERQKEEVLAMLSHDLRQPLAIMKGRADLLRRRLTRGEPPTTQRMVESLAVISTTVDDLTAGIAEMVDAARLRAGEPLDLHRAEVDVVELAASAVTSWEGTSERHDVQLQCGLSSLIINADAARVRRVLDNLLSNAVKYSPRGGEITVRVWTETAADLGPVAVIAVEDHGMGIPADDMPRIFDGYFRGANARSAIEGSGVGLAGAVQIVDQHGGAIGVTSEVGQGSCFTVRLPLGQSE
ncbi:MAG: hypothetical protein NVSMB2_12570 [Chloroflexota bacterium]